MRREEGPLASERYLAVPQLVRRLARPSYLDSLRASRVEGQVVPAVKKPRVARAASKPPRLLRSQAERVGERRRAEGSISRGTVSPVRKAELVSPRRAGSELADGEARRSSKVRSERTCKPRPETSKGSGGSRAFVPWCR